MQIGLAGQKRRDLQNVENLARGFALRRLVNVGQDRHSELFRALRRESSALPRMPGTAKRLDGRAIRLVEGRLEDERNAAAPRDLLQLRRHEEDVIAAFDDARTGNEEQVACQIDVEIRNAYRTSASLALSHRALADRARQPMFVRRINKRREQRMRRQRLRFEFRMELAARNHG